MPPSPASVISPLPRRRSSLAAAAGGLVLLLAVPAPAIGQAPQVPAGDVGPPLRVAAHLGAYNLLGDDFPDIGAGPGLGVALRGRLSRRVSLGAGLHHGWHSAPRLPSSFRLLALTVEPRFRLPPLAGLWGVRPFVGLRGGYARWEAHESSEELDAEVSARGLQAAAVAGVSAPVADELHVEVAAEAAYVAFGDARVDARVENQTPVRDRDVPGSPTDGFLLGLRAALVAPLPWP